MKFNIEFVIGVAYIVFMVGFSMALIGEMTSGPALITWKVPLRMLLFVGAPFFFGYCAGKRK